MVKQENEDGNVHAEFAKRLTDAANSNPSIPPYNSGRLVYIADKLKSRGVDVSVETVRKWFNGETRPRTNRLGILAEILRVDEISLLSDHVPETSQQPDVGQVERHVAMLLEAEGAHIAFPREGDVVAQQNQTDMYAIINGTMRSITVVSSKREGDDYVFHVPVDARPNVVVGLARIAPFAYDLVVLDWSRVKLPKEGMVETKVSDLCWVKATSLAAIS